MLVNFGFAVLFAIYGISVYWLIVVAFTANIFAQPMNVRFNILWTARQEGRFLQANFFMWLLPTVTGFIIQALIYWVALQFI